MVLQWNCMTLCPGLHNELFFLSDKAVSFSGDVFTLLVPYASSQLWSLLVMGVEMCLPDLSIWHFNCQVYCLWFSFRTDTAAEFMMNREILLSKRKTFKKGVVKKSQTIESKIYFAKKKNQHPNTCIYLHLFMKCLISHYKMPKAAGLILHLKHWAMFCILLMGLMKYRGWAEENCTVSVV